MIEGIIKFVTSPEVKIVAAAAGIIIGITAIGEASDAVDKHYEERAGEAVRNSDAVKTLETKLESLNLLKQNADDFEKIEAGMVDSAIEANQRATELKETIHALKGSIAQRTKEFKASFGLDKKIEAANATAKQALADWDSINEFENKESTMKSKLNKLKDDRDNQKRLAERFDDSETTAAAIKTIQKGYEEKAKDLNEALAELRKDRAEYAKSVNDKAAEDIANLRKEYEAGLSTAVGDMPYRKSNAEEELKQIRTTVRAEIEGNRSSVSRNAFEARRKWNDTNNELCRTVKKMMAGCRNVPFSTKVKVYMHDNVPSFVSSCVACIPIVIYIRVVIRFLRSAYAEDPMKAVINNE